MAYGMIAAPWQKDRASVHQSDEIALHAPVVVALAVHHRDPERRPSQAAAGARLKQHVFAGALFDAVLPILPILRVAARILHEPPVVVALVERDRRTGRA